MDHLARESSPEAPAGHSSSNPPSAPATAASVPPHTPASRRALLLRLACLAIATWLCAIGYNLMLQRFDVSEEAVEEHFGVDSSKAGIELYVQALVVDPINQTLQMRINVLPNKEMLAARRPLSERDISLHIMRSNVIERVRVESGQALIEVTRNFDMTGGSVRDYPFDEYNALIRLEVFERDADGKETPVPVHVKTWEAILGFYVTGKQALDSDPHQLLLQLQVRRSGAVAIFSTTLYAAMIVLTACSLAIGALVFLGIRRIEATLVGALGAIVFALPALRNAMPGAPPLGVRVDVLVFFWAEFGAVAGLFLFVSAWARDGQRPDHPGSPH